MIALWWGAARSGGGVCVCQSDEEWLLAGMQIDFLSLSGRWIRGRMNSMTIKEAGNDVFKHYHSICAAKLLW